MIAQILCKERDNLQLVYANRALRDMMTDLFPRATKSIRCTLGGVFEAPAKTERTSPSDDLRIIREVGFCMSYQL